MLEKAGATVEYIREFAETKIDKVKLNTAEMLSLGIAKMMMFIFIGTMSVIALLFFLVAAAFALTTYLDSPIMGFSLVGFGIIGLTILIFLFRKAILFNPIVDLIIETFYDENDY